MLRQQDVGHRIVVRRIVGIREGRPALLRRPRRAGRAERDPSHLATAQGRLRVPVPRCTGPSGCRRPAGRPPPPWSRWSWPPTRPGRPRYAAGSATGCCARPTGWTGRANSALPVGDPDRPLPAAVDAVERWYADHGQPAMVNTPLPLAAPVGAELDARGWSTRPPTLVQTAPLAPYGRHWAGPAGEVPRRPRRTR